MGRATFAYVIQNVFNWLPGRASFPQWARKSPSIEDVARRAACELTSIVAEAEAQMSGENNSGYENFSQYYLVFLFFWF